MTTTADEVIDYNQSSTASNIAFNLSMWCMNWNVDVYQSISRRESRTDSSTAIAGYTSVFIFLPPPAPVVSWPWSHSWSEIVLLWESTYSGQTWPRPRSQRPWETETQQLYEEFYSSVRLRSVTAWPTCSPRTSDRWSLQESEWLYIPKKTIRESFLRSPGPSWTELSETDTNQIIILTSFKTALPHICFNHNMLLLLTKCTKKILCTA